MAEIAFTNFRLNRFFEFECRYLERTGYHAIAATYTFIAVPNNRPGNLLLYATESANVKIAGNGSFYGGIIAPKSAVTATGNGDIFGAVIAKTYTQSGNSATHFDLSLKGIAGPASEGPKTVHITAWQELNSLAWGTGS